MNAYFWIILAALTALRALDAAAQFLNLRALEPRLPAAFRDIYDEREYRRLLDYTAVNTRFDLLVSGIDFALLFAFWLGGGFAWLSKLVITWTFHIVSAAWSPLSSIAILVGGMDAQDDLYAVGKFAPDIIHGLLFVGLLILGKTIIDIPFDLWSTFVIEQRFGFNKTTPAIWLADQFKSLALTAALGGPILAGILALFKYGGPLAWLWGWVFTAAAMVLLAYIAPAIILPLFNKFTPLAEGPLRRAILDYGRAQDFPIADLYVMDGSRRSTKSNAFFTGFGRWKKIALFDTLIAAHTPDELLAVLAHEVGHYKLRHILQHIAVSILSLGVFFFLASHFVESVALHQAFFVERAATYTGLAFFLVLFTPLSRLLSVLGAIWTRQHEFDADRFAAETTGQPAALASALKKLSRENLSNLAPHPLYVALYHSHPPVLRRIEALAQQAR